MTKRLFQILDEMNVKDEENNTQTVAISNVPVETKSCKQDGLVTMGVDHLRLQQLALDGKNHIALLMVIDKNEFLKIKDYDRKHT